MLLVEPDAAERSRLRSGLERAFVVTEAARAEEAVGRLEERLYDAILTAYELGEPDGVWLLRHVAKRHPFVHRTLMAGTFVPDLGELLASEVVMICEQKPLSPEHYARYFADREEDAEI